VGDLMRRQFACLAPDDALSDATEAMRLARVRHLSVALDGILVGLVSYRNVLEAWLSIAADEAAHDSFGPDALRVADVMVHNPFAVTADRSLADAAVSMLRLQIGCLPVVEATTDGPRLVGLLTEADLLRAAYLPSLDAPPAGP
jgi:acetoin utilization protein AcuB